MRPGQLAVGVLLLGAVGVGAADLCETCECLPPGPGPTQAFCRYRGDKMFTSTTTDASSTLELIYIHGIETVDLGPVSIVTLRPVTLLVQNCSRVSLADDAVTNIRNLLIRDGEEVSLGSLPAASLWAVELENIKQLTVTLSSMPVNYSLSIGHVSALNLLPPDPGAGDSCCSDNVQISFSLFESSVKHIPSGGLTLCGGHISINGSLFESVAEDGFRLSTEGSIAIVNNEFVSVAKQSFNLTAPEIHLTSNRFHTLPAGALRGVATLHDAFFTENTVEDADLGGVLLDMGWDMVVEQNRFECDCASKRTSLLNPKEDMLFLTNSSHDKLQNIFLNNYCSLNCSVSLKEFSLALIGGEVCLTNGTVLEEEALCLIATEPPEPETTTPTPSEPPPTTPGGNIVSAATRPEFLVPLGLVLLTLLVTSSVCYGCKEINTFKFTFTPNSHSSPGSIDLTR